MRKTIGLAAGVRRLYCPLDFTATVMFANSSAPVTLPVVLKVSPIPTTNRSRICNRTTRKIRSIVNSIFHKLIEAIYSDIGGQWPLITIYTEHSLISLSICILVDRRSRKVNILSHYMLYYLLIDMCVIRLMIWTMGGALYAATEQPFELSRPDRAPLLLKMFLCPIKYFMYYYLYLFLRYFLLTEGAWYSVDSQPNYHVVQM